MLCYVCHLNFIYFLFLCQSCSRILLSEEVCREYLKTMRKLDRLHKIDLTKKIMKMFANKKEILCFRCGYVNGMVLLFL